MALFIPFQIWGRVIILLYVPCQSLGASDPSCRNELCSTALLQQLQGKNITYSVKQSYANSFWGDVVLDSFNYVSKDEGNILDQIYKNINNICSNFYYADLKFWERLKKMQIYRYTALYKKELIKLGLSDNSMLVCIIV